MAYAAQEAFALNASQRARELQRPQPQFEVVEGAGLDARARQGVSPEFVTAIRRAVVAVLIVCSIGAARVSLYTQAVTSLSASTEIRAQIKEAQALEADLRVTKSVLGDVSRIERIATENYGMVLGEEQETIRVTLPGTGEESAETPSDSAADVD